MRVGFWASSALLCIGGADAFLSVATNNMRSWTMTTKMAAATTDATVEQKRTAQKEALLGLIGRKKPSSPEKEGYVDPVLADPLTKESVRISASGPLLGGSKRSSIKYNLQTSTNAYSGTSDTYINLLEPATTSTIQEDSANEPQDVVRGALNSLRALVPPPLRSALAMGGDDEYVPMRDLFTSPAVSFAYERGWRQGFAQAGFPGADIEYQMARDYFAPAVAKAELESKPTTIVDMSCATGLFTRRLAKSNEYDRVLGCDYSESMLLEARRRIRADAELARLSKTRLDLVRCDVGQIPLQTNSIDALHAGAAMHCWPDLTAATQEIYRVLKPNGGRYFATTFLAPYFLPLQQAERGVNVVGPSKQAFQYFESVDQLRKLMEDAGFEHNKVQIEVLGTACVVIRCEK